MFDFITRRRLIVCVTAILFLIISILFIAHLHSKINSSILSYYTLSSSNISIDKDQQISTCYLTEPVDILTLCGKCTSYEQRSKAVGCSPTGYREFVLCSKTDIKTYRSCQVPSHIQKQHFWIFEGFIFLIGLFAITNVYSRQRTLDKQMVEKIKRQIEVTEE